MNPGALKTQKDLIKLRFALPADEWIIALVPENGHGRVIREIIRHRDLFSSKYVEWFRARNANGCHIYGRPNSTRYVLIDDVKPESIDRLKQDGLIPTAIVETSPGNFQVWITASDEELPIPVATQLAKLLEQRYSSDKGSADALHLGRLPGLRNKKPKYQTYPGDGGPLVKLILARTNPMVPDAIGELLDQARELAEQIGAPSPSAHGACVTTNFNDEDHPIEIFENGLHVVTMSAKYEVGDITTAYQRALDEMRLNGYNPTTRKRDGNIDRSAQDICVARHLLSRCVPKQTVVEVIEFGSEKAAEREPKYARRTVDAAF